MASAARKLLTIEDWISLPDSEKCELIEGDFVYKSMPSFEHGQFQGNLRESLSKFNRKNDGGNNPPFTGWWFATEVAVAYEGRSNGFIHDIAGWRRDKHKEKPKGKKVIIKPDWVCEILSGNKSNDLITKKWVLHEHRVEYYWIVDLEEEIVQVFRWSEEGYTNISDAKKGEKKKLEPFEAIEMDIAFLFGYD
ncbi:MAG: Uma2 family endonuclease [Bdellovibrionota bacterium]